MEKIMMNASELSELLSIKKYRATKIIAEVNRQREAAGEYVIRTRPAIAPAKAIMKYLNLEEKKK